MAVKVCAVLRVPEIVGAAVLNIAGTLPLAAEVDDKEPKDDLAVTRTEMLVEISASTSV